MILFDLNLLIWAVLHVYYAFYAVPAVLVLFNIVL